MRSLERDTATLAAGSIVDYTQRKSCGYMGKKPSHSNEEGASTAFPKSKKLYGSLLGNTGPEDQIAVFTAWGSSGGRG